MVTSEHAYAALLAASAAETRRRYMREYGGNHAAYVMRVKAAISHQWQGAQQIADKADVTSATVHNILRAMVDKGTAERIRDADHQARWVYRRRQA